MTDSTKILNSHSPWDLDLHIEFEIELESIHIFWPLVKAKDFLCIIPLSNYNYMT